MSALTAIADDHASAVVANFDVGALHSYWPAAEGIENSNYFVRTDRADFVLTILEQPPAAGDGYLDLMRLLHQHGLPVPMPYADRHQRFWFEIDGKAALLQPRLPGHHVEHPTSDQIAAVGRFLARMHRATQRIELPSYPRDLDWLQQKRRHVIEHLGYQRRQLLDTALTNVQTTLQRNDVAQLPRGVIHGDLFRDNALFLDRALTGVLDFHHASTGYQLFDLAVVINDWCTDTRARLNTDNTMALLTAYNGLRPLGKAELWYLPAFQVYAATVFWLSRLATALAPESEDARNKNPEEFERIVSARMDEFYYPDPRIFLA